MTAPLAIRPFDDADWPGVWAILEPVIRAGETFPHPVAMSESAARENWTRTQLYSYVAEDETGAIVGAFAMRANQMERGAHVANASYVVAEAARGRGVATAMCRASQEIARKAGFRAMQFNLVVATNKGAVKAWTRAGMKIVGLLPKAFNHRRLGYVDAYVMYTEL